MAREKHLVDLTIGNFKRFANFEVKNLGQFNLIVGDNNTGKTSLLEASSNFKDASIWNLNHPYLDPLKEFLSIQLEIPLD